MPGTATILSSSSNNENELSTKHLELNEAETENILDDPCDRLWSSTPQIGQHQQFLGRIILMMNQHVFESTSRDTKVLEWMDPSTLQRTIDFDLRQSGSDNNALLEEARKIIKYSVKTGHPYFMNQLFSSLDPYGLAGQWITDALNPSVYTYEVSPVFSLMEETVLAKMRTYVGYTSGDGIFCPGGSMANGYAINLARYKKFPEIKTKGLHGLPRLVLFTSEDAHYSVKKLASLEGIGSDNVYLVKTDCRGKMDPENLKMLVEKSLEEGAVPFMVSATSGTTVMGAYDPLEEIHEICKKYDMWMHVDAAWGGGALMSKKYRRLLNGINKSDSVTWNPHKMLAAPQQCSTLLTRHSNLLTEAHSTSASYLFQPDKFYPVRYDSGDKHIQCGRRADVLKFWFMWKAKGSEGLEKHVDTLYENAVYFTERIRNRPGFKLVMEHPECTNITFFYIPPRLRNFSMDFKNPEFYQQIHKVAPLIKERMMREGTMMITYQPHGTLPNFFRLVMQNSCLTKNDMDYVINEIERLGRDL